MAKGQSAALDHKKLMADPIMMTTIVVLIAFLSLFILYPLAILLVDSLYNSKGFSFDAFQRIGSMKSAINTIFSRSVIAGFPVVCHRIALRISSSVIP